MSRKSSIAFAVVIISLVIGSAVGTHAQSSGLISPPPANWVWGHDAAPPTGSDVRYPATVPYPSGLVGDGDRVVTVTAERAVVRQRNNVLVSERDLDLFLDADGPDGPYISKCKAMFDPFDHIEIYAGLAYPRRPESALRLKLGGGGSLALLDLDPLDLTWGEDLNIGLNRDWIVVQVNMHSIATGAFVRSQIFVFPRASLVHDYDVFTYTVFSDESLGASQVPALTYDATLSTLYLVQNWTGNQNGSGYLRVYAISGPVGSETLTTVGFVGASEPWSDTHPIVNGGFAPQKDTDRRIMLGDSRIQSVTYRNGALWAVQTIFLPAAAPTRSAIQWWQITPAAVAVQRGRLDADTGAFYGYPSMAVNRPGDVLIGYTRFAADDYASGAYAFRAAHDPAGTLRAEQKHWLGFAPYRRALEDGTILLGGTSATVVDPANDVDFWTLQTTAAVTTTSYDLWSVNWQRVTPSHIDSLTANVSSPAAAGVPIQWTAHGGDSPPLEYQFRLLDQATSTWTVVRPFAGSNSFVWTPDQPGAYTIEARVRWINSGADYDAIATADFVVERRPPDITSLATNVALPAPPGTTITWTASAHLGLAPLQYCFWLYDKRTESWTLAQPYGPSNTFTWTPTPAEAGVYTIQAWVRSSDVSDAYEDYASSDYFTIAGGGATLGALQTGDPLPGRTGDPLNWRVNGWGGGGPLEYEFSVFSTSASTWTVARPYGPSSAFVWTPAEPDTYRARVRARTVGSSAAFEAESETAPFGVTAGPVRVLSLESDRLLPAAAGDTVTWTARAIGGSDLRYRFMLHNMKANMVTVQDDSPTTTFTWTSDPADLIGKTPYYALEVWVRSNSAVEYEAHKSDDIFTLAPAAGSVTITALNPDVLSPAAPGTPITWTAYVPTAPAGLQYQFWRYSASAAAWSIVQDYGTTRTYTWTPAASESGTYGLQVRVRRFGSATDYDGLFTTASLFEVGGASGPSIDELSPDRAGILTTDVPITWTTHARGGSARLEYRYWRWNGAIWRMVRDYAPDPTYTWTPTPDEAGTYVLQVWVRGSGSTASYEGFSSVPVTLAHTPFSLSLSTPAPAPSRYDDAFIWQATPQGGEGPLEYQFVLENGSGSTVVQDYSPRDFYYWTPGPSGIGDHTLRVYARCATTSVLQGSASSAISVTYAPVRVTLSADHTLPAPAGTALTWTASTIDGIAPHTFDFWRYDASAATWTHVQPTSASNTYSWTPTAGERGRYVVLVSVQSTAAAMDYAVPMTDYFTIGGGGLTIASLDASNSLPGQTGQPLGWRAVAWGGTDPLEYEFALNDGTPDVWTVLCAYRAGDACAWTPSRPGTFTVRVRARSAGGTTEDAERTSAPFAVTAAPLVVTAVTTDIQQRDCTGLGDVPVNVAVRTTGGSGDLEYRFVVISTLRSTPTAERAYRPSSEFVFTPQLSDVSPPYSIAARYLVQVYVRHVGSVSAYDAYGDSGWVMTSNPPWCSGATLTADTSFPAAPGTRITWTAMRLSPDPASEYRFERQNLAGGSWVVIQDYAVARTVSWTPTLADKGSYTIRVLMREPPASTASMTVTAAVTAVVDDIAPPRIESLAGPSTVVPGRATTWTALGTGGDSPLEYRFWRYSYASGSWSIVQEYGSNRTYEWTPMASELGTFVIQIWARRTGQPASWEATASTEVITVSSGGGVSMDSYGKSIDDATYVLKVDGGGHQDYQFQIQELSPTPGPWVVVQDFSPTPALYWRPSYPCFVFVRVVARNRATGAIVGSAEWNFSATP